MRFHFLDEAGMTLNVLDRSRFNIIVSNTQKIILKRQHKDKTPIDALHDQPRTSFHCWRLVYGSTVTSMRLISWKRGSTHHKPAIPKALATQQLGIYVDEAHHAFGKHWARTWDWQRKNQSQA